MSTVRPPGIVSRVRNLDRIRQISEVAIRHGFGYVFERHNLWDLLRLRRRKGPPPPEQRGRHIREMFEELGPTFVKFGQLLSTRPDIVPPDVIEELVELQDRVPSFPSDAARAVIEEELGLTVERVFESFDDVPLAAASIGQVHRAVLPGGKNVIVKVQRPGISHRIDRDIDLFYQIAHLLRDHFSERVFIDPVNVVDEFARSIVRELDYVLEGRNAERFAENFKGEEMVQAPTVYWPLTTRRILTLEQLPGKTLSELDYDTLDLGDRRKLAETLYDAWFRQILEHGFFHGDPHPANLVYMGPSSVGLIDFGITGMLAPGDLEEGTRLFLAVMDQDIEGIKRRLRKLDVEWDPDRDDEMTIALRQGLSRYFGVSLSDLDPAALLHDVFYVIYTLHLQLPTRFLILDKALLTLEGVVTEVYADFNAFEKARPYARQLVRKQYSPEALANRLTDTLGTYGELVAEYPFQLHDILEKAKRGQLEIKFVHRGLDSLIHKLDIVTNRMVVALVASTVGLASSLLAVFVESGPQLLGVSVWGVPGFVAAFLFGVWLIWGIVRSGRL